MKGAALMNGGQLQVLVGEYFSIYKLYYAGICDIMWMYNLDCECLTRLNYFPTFTILCTGDH